MAWDLSRDLPTISGNRQEFISSTINYNLKSAKITTPVSDREDSVSIIVLNTGISVPLKKRAPIKEKLSANEVSV